MPGKHVCGFCFKSFKKNAKLERHVRTHTGEKPFACEHPGCGKAFIDDYHLQRHVKCHTGERPHQCTVPGCTHAFREAHHLKSHLTWHDSHPAMQCVHCSAIVFGAEALRSHCCPAATAPATASVHRGLAQRCDGGQSEGHGADVARGDPGSGVDDCAAGGIHDVESDGAASVSSAGEQPALAPLPCPHPGCAREFNSRRSLNAHAASHRTRQCPQCGANVQSRRFLAHVRTHDPARLRVPCPQCGKTYSSVSNLNIHQRARHGEGKPFACPAPGCQRAFCHKHSLEKHMRVHEEAGGGEGQGEQPRRPQRVLEGGEFLSLLLRQPAQVTAAATEAGADALAGDEDAPVAKRRRLEAAAVSVVC